MARSLAALDVDAVRATEILVLGGGVGGLAAALGCAPRATALLTKGRLGEAGSSAWAQGGVAVALGEGDSPRLHAADTLAAGAGLSRPALVEILTAEGPRRVLELLRLGARFDRGAGGELAFGREAAHGRRRILHAAGDATGAEMVRALVAAVREQPGLEVVEETTALDLVLEGGVVRGLLALDGEGRRILWLAASVVLATGGIGHLYAKTTNPPEVSGDGLAMAFRAGARVRDVEMVQFHPTALAVGEDPLPLLTEALRGEGAQLLDGSGRRFMVDEHPLAELAPRDVVARAIWRRLEAGDEVLLDATEVLGDAFADRFPTVFSCCRERGLDPRRQGLPVTPAAHYHMGGVAVDAWGRTSLPGLWACGEVAATGVHGANRLASNSLLEALVFGGRVADDLRGRLAVVPSVGEAPALARRLVTAAPFRREPGDGRCGSLEPAIRRLMWERVGLVREGEGLRCALDELAELEAKEELSTPEERNLLTVARLVATAALAREESRGGHFRADFPAADPTWCRHLHLEADSSGAPRVLSERAVALAGQAATAVQRLGRGRA